MNYAKTVRLRMKSYPSLAGPVRAVESAYRFARSSLGLNGTPAVTGYHLIRGGEVEIEVPDYEGTFFLDARSHILRRLAQTGCFEPDSARAVKEHLHGARDAIDVGANVGLFSVLFRRRLNADRRVLAIEPTPLASTLLRRNLLRNDIEEGVEVFEGFAGDQVGSMQIEVVAGREEYSSPTLAHRSVSGLSKETLQVPMKTVDSLVSELELEPGFVKIDVEGSELRVLGGMTDTIRRFRPVLLMEYGPDLLRANGASGEGLIQFLNHHDYQVTWLTTGEIVAVPARSHSS